MPRFVVLQHDHPESLHWDFMLESDAGLATWSLPLPPCYSHVIAAKPLPVHRKAYLDYEGPVSNGRGSVARWDHGTFEAVLENEQCVEAILCGRKLIGRVRLERAETPGDWRWLLTAE